MTTLYEIVKPPRSGGEGRSRTSGYRNPQSGASQPSRTRPTVHKTVVERPKPSAELRAGVTPGTGGLVVFTSS